MSSVDFRKIAHGGGIGRAEELFRAAISAFCSLTRPSRGEIAQLDDLALPLFESVSSESRRYAAAALSECETVPAGLLRRLCDEPIEICAPLLIRSASLRDIDLLGLIGRHGLGHARAIARRRQLNPAIANIIKALMSHGDPDGTPAAPAPERTEQSPVESVRHQLRAMMRPSARDAIRRSAGRDAVPDAYGKLRTAALTGVPILFEATLSDLAGIDRLQARRMVAGSSYGTLAVVLRALDLTVEQAFVIAAAMFGSAFAHAEAVRLFIERFEAIDRNSASESLRGWKADAVAAATAQGRAKAQTANAGRRGIRHA